MPGKDVLRPLTQRREHDLQHVETKILSESPFFDRLVEIPVRGGQDADIRRPGHGFADPFEDFFLEEAEELGLELGRKLPDLVRKRVLSPPPRRGRRGRAARR